VYQTSLETDLVDEGPRCAIDPERRFAMSKIAVISPSTLLGREVVSLLAELPGPPEMVLFSERMAGAELAVAERDVTIEDLDAESLVSEGAPAVAIFAGVAQQSRRFAGRLGEAGTRVVDLTSAFRLEKDVPLLTRVPAGAQPPLVSIAGGAALAAYRSLEPVLEPLGLSRLDATFLVPVSASGAAGVRELSNQTAKLLSGQSPKPRHFPHRIAFNVQPGPGERVGQDTRSEVGFREELRRLVGQPALPVWTSTVRVPVFFGLSFGLTFETARPTTLEALEGLYRAPSEGRHKLLVGTGAEPMPSLAAGDPAVLVGRLRGEGTRWQLWGCVDPLRMRAELCVAVARRFL
jgi:aspartate-semialdehyde dehydrogenase